MSPEPRCQIQVAWLENSSYLFSDFPALALTLYPILKARPSPPPPVEDPKEVAGKTDFKLGAADSQETGRACLPWHRLREEAVTMSFEPCTFIYFLLL